MLLIKYGVKRRREVPFFSHSAFSVPSFAEKGIDRVWFFARTSLVTGDPTTVRNVQIAMEKPNHNQRFSKTLATTMGKGGN